MCKKKRAQSRSISGRRCSLDWERDFTQIGGLDRLSMVFTYFFVAFNFTMNPSKKEKSFR
ncbi:GTP pyrophosphokinase [Caldibacillus debilis]|uniref:GTP pyrophosphokinase n=1 Tax=Caldibacillus debilis TaxID=301148 RepID=A0A150L6S7_9BACI|nr:GTP pyrophosphokinase [Caldibacillus debilis]